AILPRRAGPRRVPRAIGVRGWLRLGGAWRRRDQRDTRSTRRRDGGGGRAGVTRGGARRALLLGVALLVGACARAPRVDEAPRGAARLVRVVLAAGVAEVAVSSADGLDVI